MIYIYKAKRLINFYNELDKRAPVFFIEELRDKRMAAL